MKVLLKIKKTVMKKMANKKNKYDFWLTILKSGTYAIAGTVSSVVIQLTQSGYDLTQAIILGCGIGIIAGVKNVFKNAFSVDLDLVTLKK